MNIILVGPPGSGKGTQAENIIKDYKVAHISPGDMLRKHKKDGTELGMKANEYMQKGELVPDEIVVKMIEQRISEDDCKGGFMLDGFPRSLSQAKALDEMLEKQNMEKPVIINIVVSEDELVDRLLKRGRADDNEETIKSRLKVFNGQTSPVIEYYSEKGSVHEINGVGSIEGIYAEIKKVLDNQ